MTFKDLINQTAKTPKEIETKGFPEKVTQAFLNTADTVNSVVMSRVPGGAATTLINEGYDLKGMFIKVKSCDWGPMAGFVCELLPFNKKGAGGVEFNRSKIQEYEKKLQAESDSPVGFGEKKVYPYIQIKISDKRKQEIVQNSEKDKLILTKVEDRGQHGKKIWGFACDKKEKSGQKPEGPTVLMQFLMKKEGTHWELYHGKIWIMQNSQVKEYKDGVASQKSIKESVSWNNPQLPNDFSGITFDNGECDFFPIRGLMNPWPPYKGDENYKNAVAGDYDLFAVWPLYSINEKELERATEVLQESFKIQSQNSSFGRSNSKELSVYSATNNKVYIEFVPERAEEEEMEKTEISDQSDNWKGLSEKRIRNITEFSIKGMGPDILRKHGNINNKIYETTQMLNNLVQFIYTRAHSVKNYPSRAFHSDECGRPGVTEIDYPFAVFLPESLSTISPPIDNKGKILLIKKHEQFATLINLLKDKYYVLLNFVWVSELMNKMNSGSNGIKKDLKEILLGISEGQNGDKELETIKKRLNDVATAQKQRIQNNTPEDGENIKSKDKIKHFMKPFNG
jgi:hypothetical protein